MVVVMKQSHSFGECWLSLLCSGLFSLPCKRFSSCLWNGEVRILVFKRKLKFSCVPMVQQMGHSDETNQLPTILSVSLAEWGFCISSLCNSSSAFKNYTDSLLLGWKRGNNSVLRLPDCSFHLLQRWSYLCDHRHAVTCEMFRSG